MRKLLGKRLEKGMNEGALKLKRPPRPAALATLSLTLEGGDIEQRTSPSALGAKRRRDERGVVEMEGGGQAGQVEVVCWIWRTD
jgi:hypothetical protein